MSPGALMFLDSGMPKALAGGLGPRVTPLKGIFLLPVAILFQLCYSNFFLVLRDLDLLVYSYSHCSVQRRTLQLCSEVQPLPLPDWEATFRQELLSRT